MILLVAKSGVGKNYVCNKLGLREVLSRTTRRPRFKGENTHTFVSNNQADREWNCSIARTNFNGNRYYVLKEDLINKDVYIIDAYGVRNMNKSDIGKCTTIYMTANIITRFIHMYKRGDSIKNIITRLIHDRKAFKGFESEADYVVNYKQSEELIKYLRNEEWE